MSEPESPERGEAELVSHDQVHVGERRPTIVEHRFIVETECHGWRLDRFLQKRIRRLSRSRIQRVIDGDCQVAGRVARPGMRVFSGQLVSFSRPAPPEPEVPRNIGIVYTDPSFYVIDKPAGLPIHPTARYHYSTLTAVLRERFPGESLQCAHRLDRETSGLMLVARTPQAASFLKTAFQRRLVHKRYLAIVHGLFEPDHVVLDQPIGPANSVVRVRMAVRDLASGGQPSRTEVDVLQRGQRYTLVECRPFTGRQHQIRVHLNSIGYPIVGDKLYPDESIFLRWVDRGLSEADGESDDEGEPGAALEDSLAVPDDSIAADPNEPELVLPRHALHAAALSFPHPLTGETVEVASALPPDLADFFARDC